MRRAVIYAATLAAMGILRTVAQAGTYMSDNFTYQGSTPTASPVYTKSVNPGRPGNDITWIFNWPEDNTGATSPLPGYLRVDYSGSVGFDEQTQIRNDVTLTSSFRIDVDTRSFFASGNYMEGLVLSESTTPWSSGKSVLFAWDDVNERWEIRLANGPISGQYQNAGSTLLGTINTSRIGSNYDHLTITLDNGVYTFDANGVDATGVAAFSGNFQYAGLFVGEYGLGGQTRFDNFQYSTVPEPASACFLLIGGSLLSCRRRRIV